MLDIQGVATAAPNIARPPIEFLRIELASMADGKVAVSMTATTVDEEEPQLLDQEIARGLAATIDDVVMLIRAHVRVVPSFS